MNESRAYSITDWFFCEDIRQEVNNKLSYMGVFDNSILCETIPIILPKIFVSIKLETKKGPIGNLFLRIMQPDGTLLAGPMEIKLNIIDPKNPRYKINIGIAPFNIQKMGKHKLEISLDGKQYESIGALDAGLMQK